MLLNLGAPHLSGPCEWPAVVLQAQHLSGPCELPAVALQAQHRGAPCWPQLLLWVPALHMIIGVQAPVLHIHLYNSPAPAH